MNSGGGIGVSKGILMAMRNGNTELANNAVLQVIKITRIASKQPNNSPRYNVTVSDGQNSCIALLSTEANLVVEEGRLRELCLIKVIDCILNDAHGRKLLILYKIEVLSGPVAKVGDPIDLDRQPQQGGARGAYQPQPQQQPPSRFGGSQPHQQQSRPAYPQQQPHHQQQQPQQYHHQQQPQQQYQPQPPQQQPQQNFRLAQGAQGRNQPIARTGNSFSANDIKSGEYQPISSLNPYQSSWIIKARVVSKSDIKEWNKPTSQGKLFSVDLLDEWDGEIRAVFFNEMVDRYYHVLQVGNVYMVSKGRLKFANKRFSTVKNDFEITTDENTIIEPVSDSGSIKMGNFDFKPLEILQDSVADNDMVDVVAIVEEVGDTAEINTKQGMRPRRTVKLVDRSQSNPSQQMMVELTLWGDKCSTIDNVAQGTAVVFKDLRKTSFGGVSLNSTGNTTVLISPAIPEAESLMSWYVESRASGNIETQSLTNRQDGGDRQPREARPRHTLAHIADENLGHSERGDYITVKAYLSHIRTSTVCYPACDAEQCRNKKLREENGAFVCPSCSNTTYTPNYRYLLNVVLSDHTGERWATVFDTEARILMGMSADELIAVKEADESAFDRTLTERTWTEWVFSLRIKEEQGFNPDSGPRVRVSVTRVYPIYPTSESKKLLGLIEMYRAREPNAFL